MKSGRILIVDDEAVIREMLESDLEEEYDVLTADSADSAFKILKLYPIDLVISDINMPGMKGYELLQSIRDSYPHIRTALITAYNIDDYIRMAKNNRISNIICKTTPFNFDEFRAIVRGLVSEDIFGLDKYMLPDFENIAHFTIKSSSEILDTENKVIDSIRSFTRPHDFVQVLLEELITNAMYHAPVTEFGDNKYEKHSSVNLEETEKITIAVGKDSEKYGVSVVDTSGRLTSDQVLYRIDRHTSGEGIFDTSGRGLHMTRLYADRLIINVKKEVRTEVLFLNYTSEKYHGYKPLLINEL